MDKNKLPKIANTLAPVVMFFILFGAWELCVRIFQIKTVMLPGPITIFKCLFENFAEFRPHFIVSMLTIVIGLGIAIPVGVLFAAVVTNFKLANDAIFPFVILLVTTPLMTLMPILTVWMGFGMRVRILGALIQCFPIIGMNACTGFLNVARIRMELMQSLKATRTQTFFRVVLPSGLPDVFTGIKLGTIFATTACIGIEFVASSTGLGNRISFYTEYYKTEYAFACIFLVALIGLVLYGIVSLVEKKLINWKI